MKCGFPTRTKMYRLTKNQVAPSLILWCDNSNEWECGTADKGLSDEGVIFTDIASTRRAQRQGYTGQTTRHSPDRRERTPLLGACIPPDGAGARPHYVGGRLRRPAAPQHPGVAVAARRQRGEPPQDGRGGRGCCRAQAAGGQGTVACSFDGGHAGRTDGRRACARHCIRPGDMGRKPLGAVDMTAAERMRRHRRRRRDGRRCVTIELLETDIDALIRYASTRGICGKRLDSAPSPNA